MKIEFLNAQQVGTKLNELLDCTERFYCAVAWASDMTFADGLLENEDKICQLVIGTDYLGTAPEVLQSLKSVPKVRVMLKGQVTFHPKIYCFIKDKNFFAIVGSSNLTNGGLSSNEEASVLIEGTTEDDFFKEISNKISSWWEMGVQIEDNWLSRYEEMWSKNKENRAKTKKLVDAIQEPPTIAEFNVKNSPRIRIALWVENIDKDNYSEEVPQDGEFLDEMAFLKNDDIEKGDWILSWKCKKDGNPYKSRMNWMYVDKIFLNGYKHCDYLKLAVQTKQNDLVPFRLDDGKLQSIIKEVIKSDDFAFNSENCYPTPAVVINFLTRVKLEYENSSK
jgi:HKD family nuclease